MPRQQRMIGSQPCLGSHVGKCFALPDRGRRMGVAQARRIGRETLLAHEFLGVQPALRTVEADMALSPDLPRHPVVWHFGSLAAMFLWTGREVRRAGRQAAGRWPATSSRV